MRKIRLDDSCLNHLINIPVGFTRKSSYIHNSEKSHTKNIMSFADRGCVRTWRNLYHYATGLIGETEEPRWHEFLQYKADLANNSLPATGEYNSSSGDEIHECDIGMRYIALDISTIALFCYPSWV